MKIWTENNFLSFLFFAQAPSKLDKQQLKSVQTFEALSCSAKQSCPFLDLKVFFFATAAENHFRDN
jgi:hypothetical protein